MSRRYRELDTLPVGMGLEDYVVRRNQVAREAADTLSTVVDLFTGGPLIKRKPGRPRGT